LRSPFDRWRCGCELLKSFFAKIQNPGFDDGDELMATQNFDVVVIGSGPGGYVAAIRSHN
jgi:alkyl hydroperoxide reductase subunit AhpF